METGVCFVHLVARAYRLPISLTHHDVAMWLWPRLQRAFPFAFAVVLMPNHLHILTPAKHEDVARNQLALILGNLARSGGTRAGIRFEPIPKVQLQRDPSKLMRQARYIVLNPVRAKLVNDPLAWPWSTHRDVLGAVDRPWVSASRLASVLGRSPREFSRWWHQYVARDDATCPDARRFPAPAQLTSFSSVPLESVAYAVASATRSRVAEIRRRGRARELFLTVAVRVGWDQSCRLAAFCEITQRAVQKAARRQPSHALDAVLLCLGDARLTAGCGSEVRQARTSTVDPRGSGGQVRV